MNGEQRALNVIQNQNGQNHQNIILLIIIIHNQEI
jgi:hypothetical protein